MRPPAGKRAVVEVAAVAAGRGPLEDEEGEVRAAVVDVVPAVAALMALALDSVLFSPAANCFTESKSELSSEFTERDSKSKESTEPSSVSSRWLEVPARPPVKLLLKLLFWPPWLEESSADTSSSSSSSMCPCSKARSRASLNSSDDSALMIYKE
jgi:hypothetical protein